MARYLIRISIERRGKDDFGTFNQFMAELSTAYSLDRPALWRASMAEATGGDGEEIWGEIEEGS
jgi:hypothetical protein